MELPIGKVNTWVRRRPKYEAPGWRIDRAFLGRLAFRPNSFGVPGRRINRAFLGRLAFGPSPLGLLGWTCWLGELGLGSWYPQDRLDKVVCNIEWRARFDNASVSHLPKLNVNHLPLFIKLHGSDYPLMQSTFRFQAAWFRHPDFKKEVQKQWQKETSLIANNKQIAEALTQWNKECFGNIFRKKKDSRQGLQGLKKTC